MNDKIDARDPVFWRDYPRRIVVNLDEARRISLHAVLEVRRGPGEGLGSRVYGLGSPASEGDGVGEWRGERGEGRGRLHNEKNTSKSSHSFCFIFKRYSYPLLVFHANSPCIRTSSPRSCRLRFHRGENEMEKMRRQRDALARDPTS